MRDVLTEDRRLLKSAADQKKTIVFISHQRANVEFAKELAKYIERSGVQAWLAVTQPEVQAAHIKGERDVLTTKILEGIRYATRVLIVVSRATLTSDWVPFEAGAALGATKKVGFVLGTGLEERQLPEYFSLGTRLKTEKAVDEWLADLRASARLSLAEAARSPEPLRKHMKVVAPRLVIGTR